MVVCTICNTCRRVSVDLMFRLQMVFSNVIFDITISFRSFVLSQSRAKVSVGVSPIQVARQPQHLILYTAPCLSSGLLCPLH